MRFPTVDSGLRMACGLILAAMILTLGTALQPFHAGDDGGKKVEGTLKYGDKVWEFTDVIAWAKANPWGDTTEDDEGNEVPAGDWTVILMTVDPIDLKEAKAEIAKGNSYMPWGEQLRLTFTDKGELQFLNFFGSGASCNFSPEEWHKGEIKVEGGRVKGSAKMDKPGECLDHPYTFDVTFEAPILKP